MFNMKKRETVEVHGPSLAATDEPVVEIRIEGNNTIPTAQILDQLQTRVGRPFDPMLVQRDIRKLASKSWFVGIEPLYEKTPEGRIVILKVVERPTIRYVEYLGNKGIRDKKLKKETGLKIGGSVDPYAVEEARRKIEALYHRNGYNDAQVTVLEGNKATDHGAVFVINEGASQRIWKVEFVGNTFVSGRRLKTQIQSKPPIAYVFKGFVDRDVIDGDVDRLTAYYRSFGFFQAKVGRELEYNEKGNWMTLKFVVNEGPRYDVRKVSFMGNELFADTSLALGTKLTSGQPFEQAKMNDDVEWLKEVYGSQGYIFADVRAEPVFLEEPGKIDLVYHLEEGKRWRVGRIFVHIGGDGPHTRVQTALNRLSLHPGEIVDMREVHASERRLQASSLFLTDPVRGVSPKITYRIQELGDEEIATGATGSSFRGQSPDDRPASAQEHATNYPPGTYVIEPPPGYVPSDDDVDVHLDFDASPPPTSGTSPANENTSARTGGNAYQSLIVRTQSPYQPPSTQYVQQPAGTAPAQAYYQAPPASGGAAVTQTYNATAYGGQAVGATGPEAAPIGGSASSGVVQTQATLPAPPGYRPAFGPPPMGQRRSCYPMQPSLRFRPTRAFFPTGRLIRSCPSTTTRPSICLST